MLEEFNFDLGPFLPIFSKLGLEVAFLTPTKNAYTKSIIDAIIPVRDFLKRNGIHDYEKQKQGTENKKILPAFFVTVNNCIETKASLYRPKTKKGDPRIWFWGFKNYGEPWDLLALVTDGQSIYVVDLSLEDVCYSLLSGGYVYQVLKKLSEKEQAVSKELLSIIQGIYNKGFIPTITSGDTGVGMTLENELGIPPNSSKNPDYKGIELKSSRKISSGRKNNNRVTLFSKAPDWKKSKGMTAKKLLGHYGYWGKDKNGNPRFNLACTLTATKSNPQDLYLLVDFDEDILINMRQIKDKKDEYVLQWSLETLRNRLQNKHHETFWVYAEAKIINGKEYFKYHTIVHTKKPNVSLFPYLIDVGVVTMDYTMHRKPNGEVRDHGYLFRMERSNLNLLFPNPVKYDLTKNNF